MVLIFMGFLLLLHGRCPCARLEKSTKKQNNSVPRQHDETPEPERRLLRQDDARRADPTRNCNRDRKRRARTGRSEEHTSELQSLMRISYAVYCLKKKKNHKTQTPQT